MKFKFGKAICLFMVLSLILCLSISINEQSGASFTMRASGAIDNDAIMNGTGEAIEEGLPFVLQMAFIAAGVSIVMAAIMTVLPNMRK